MFGMMITNTRCTVAAVAGFFFLGKPNEAQPPEDLKNVHGKADKVFKWADFPSFAQTLKQFLIDIVKVTESFRYNITKPHVITK